MKRWERTLLYTLAIVQAGVILMGAAPRPDVLRAQKLEIVNEAGKRVAILSSGGLALYDHTEKLGVWLSASKASAGLSLFGKTGYGGDRIMLTVTKRHGSFLRITGETGMQQIWLGSRLKGLGKGLGLKLYDEAGKQRASLDVRKGPRLRLSDEAGGMRASLGVTDLEIIKTGSTRQTAESTLVLFAKDGTVLWQAPH